MPQEPRGIRGELLGRSRDDHQAVCGVTKASPVEVCIAGEKCDLPCTAQLRQDLPVGHSRTAPIQPYLADGQPPRFEKLPLASQRVLVEQNQPAPRRAPGTEYSAACSRKLSRASLTASAMASWGTLPPTPPQWCPTASCAPLAPERPKRRSWFPETLAGRGTPAGRRRCSGRFAGWLGALRRSSRASWLA
jgi:hypothetical protein